MAKRHDFDQLVCQYPGIIAQMADVFGSHVFILTLAQRHQRLYVEALHEYREGGGPFRQVHAILSDELASSPSWSSISSAGRASISLGRFWAVRSRREAPSRPMTSRRACYARLGK